HRFSRPRRVPGGGQEGENAAEGAFYLGAGAGSLRVPVGACDAVGVDQDGAADRRAVGGAAFLSVRGGPLPGVPVARRLHAEPGGGSIGESGGGRRGDRGVARADEDGGGEGVVQAAALDGGACVRGLEGASASGSVLGSWSGASAGGVSAALLGAQLVGRGSPCTGSEGGARAERRCSLSLVGTRS